VASEDADAFAERVMRYRGNRELVAEASRRAAAYTATHFAWPAVADTFVRLLQQRIGPRTTTTGTVPAELARAAG
jgi:glycosyltransferase involved in cell wall biosynthesis